MITVTGRWICAELLLPSFFVMLVPECHCSHVGYTLILHQPADTLHDTPCVKCRILFSKTCPFVLLDANVTRLGSLRCWRGTIANTFFALSWTRQSRHERCVVVGSVQHKCPAQQHVAEWRNLPGVVHREDSPRFAKRAMELGALHSEGTIAFCLHTLRKTVQTVFPSGAPVYPRGCLVAVTSCERGIS